jgi:phosphoglycerate dehydrogenase-like enzyme
VKRQTIDPPDYFNSHDRVVTADRLVEILPETDHLILVLPGGADTDGLCGKNTSPVLTSTCSKPSPCLKPLSCGR